MAKEGPETTWVKPETKQFLHRLFLTVLILGSLGAVLIVTGWALNVAYERGARQREDRDMMERVAEQQVESIEERIAASEALLLQLQDPVSKEEERRRLATLYEEQGKIRIEEGKHDEAEASFRKASELDPANPIYPADLGFLFGLVARTNRNTNQAIQLWVESAQEWVKALELEPKPEFKNAYAQSAADAAVSACELLAESERKTEAVALLKRMKGSIPAGTRASEQVDRMLLLLAP